MEFLHGAIRSKNSNACFFIRAPQTLSDIPQDFREKFIETNKLGREQLKALKLKLKEIFPNQVFDYSCKYDGISESTQRKRLKFSGLEKFAARALNFLKEAIKKTYPDLKPVNQNNYDLNTSQETSDEIGS